MRNRFPMMLGGAPENQAVLLRTEGLWGHRGRLEFALIGVARTWVNDVVYIYFVSGIVGRWQDAYIARRRQIWRERKEGRDRSRH